MQDTIKTNVAVGEQIKLLDRQKKINTTFIIILIITFILGNIFTRFIGGAGIVLYAKVYLDYDKELKRLKNKYGFK